MALDITNNYNNYATRDTNTKSENSVITSTVELKTSKPGVTRTEAIKTGFSNTNNYSKYLQEKYNYMNTGTTFMEGVLTTVTVSSVFLKKCMNDPQKAKYLEENLAAIPDCAKMAVNGSFGTLTSLSYQIDANGNITCISSGTNDPNGKIAKENAQKKAKEKKIEEEKQAKKRKEQKIEEEKNSKIYNFTVSAVSTDVKIVTHNCLEVALDRAISKEIRFDIKA